MKEGHGDDLHHYGGKVRYNFSSNIPLPVDSLSGLRRHLLSLSSLFTSYPEPEPRSIEKLEEERGCLPDASVMVTAGVTEAIYLIAHAYSGAVSAVVIPTFSEYADACRMYGHDVRQVDSLDDIPADAGLVWLCNPNNPTGSVYEFGALHRFIAAHPAIVFIIDQAYADYTSKRVFSAHEAIDAGNVILLGSYTKRYAIPGLRIGYAVGTADMLLPLRKLRMPWSVNAVAVEAVKYLSELLVPDRSHLHAEALRMSEALRGNSIVVEPTDCNFILCRLPVGTARDLKEWLVETHGILIRDASNFHGLDSRYFRVAVQTPGADDLLIKSISEWCNIHCSQ